MGGSSLGSLSLNQNGDGGAGPGTLTGVLPPINSWPSNINLCACAGVGRRDLG